MLNTSPNYREEAGEFLKDRRDKKLTTRVNPEIQLLHYVKEDLSLIRWNR